MINSKNMLFKKAALLSTFILIFISSLLTGKTCFAISFNDDFDSTSLNSIWTVLGDMNYNLTDNPGNLRICFNGKEGIRDIGCTFFGNQWVFETKVNYSMNQLAGSLGTPSSGQDFGQAYAITYVIVGGKIFDLAARMLNGYADNVISNGLGWSTVKWNAVNQQWEYVYGLYPGNDGTHYFKFIRDNNTLLMYHSIDGIQWQQSYSEIITNPLLSDQNEILLKADFRALTEFLGTAYVEYDYIKISDTPSITVAIDPGHGLIPNTNTYRGAPPSIYNDHEDDLNLDIGSGIKSELQNIGYNVFLTRTTMDDLPGKTYEEANRERYTRANNSKPKPVDIYVSIHCNSAAKLAVNGTQNLYCPEPTKRGVDSYNLAATVHNRLKGILNTFPAGSSGIEQRKLNTVLRRTKMPAIIVETCFISNSELQSTQSITDAERLHLHYKRQAIVDNICDGIKDFIPLP